ncbi:MAG TPA: sigma-70 family RNA polymerase sigma factor [Caulobacteraceae bacterium]
MSGRIIPILSRGRPPQPAQGGRTSGAGVSADTPLPFLRPLGAGGAGGTAAAVSSPSPPSPSPASRFRELVLPHLDSAYSLARYLCRDAAAAEDIAQDALLKAFRGFDGYRGGDPRAWLLAIVRNAYFDWARRQRSWETMTVSDPDAAAEVADDEATGAEQGLIQRGDVQALRAAVEALPEPFREALVLRELEELSYKTIAEVTGAPMGTVMSRLARARQMLGRAMGLGQEARS